jgi:hypothetical protein
MAVADVPLGDGPAAVWGCHLESGFANRDKLLEKSSEGWLIFPRQAYIVRGRSAGSQRVVLVCRLRNREQYQDFLKCLNLFAQEIVAKQELQFMVQDILGRFPDLLVNFFAIPCLRHCLL